MGFPVSLHPAFQKTIVEATKAAGADDILVIYGETGTGKEHLVRAIHASSPRSDKPFVSVVISNIRNALFESELFGHEKGAFTGAEKCHKGALEQASGGTLFIDEFQNADFKMQQKILRLAESGEYRTVGGEAVKRFQGRMMFAMNDHPNTLLANRKLLPDMYFRIAHTVLGIPPLRLRREDIPALIADSMREFGADGYTLAPEDEAFIEEYGFPGNVRELLSLVRKACANRTDHTISLKQTWASVHEKPEWYQSAVTPKTFSPGKNGNDKDNIIGVHCDEACKLGSKSYREAKEHVERHFIAEALERTGGNVTQAAELLGIHRRQLSRKIKQYGLGKNGET